MEEIGTIYERMRERFAQEAGYDADDGCDLMVRLYALSAEVQSLLAQADWVLAQSFPQTAQGQYLDYHAAARALTRSPGAKARGTLRFFAAGTAASDYAIARGTVCMTAAQVRFETTEDAVLPRGAQFVDVAARAVEPGAAGNVSAGSVTAVSAFPAGIASCTNPAAFTGGTDAESDDALRARILESYRRLPNGGNAAYYEEAALSHDGVAAAKAVGRSRGTGTVDVYIASADGMPDAALLEEVRADLQEKREIAVDLRVLAPTAKNVAVRCAVRAKAGYDGAAVRSACEQALRAYFTGARLGQSVLTAHLTALLVAVEGVENVRLSAPSADVSVAETELPVISTLTVTEL